MANRVPFDDRLNQRARVEDLSRELMCDFLKEVGSDLADRAAQLSLVELGRQMNVVGGSVDAPFPLNVGLLFFNPEPHRLFPATQIDVVWVPNGTGGEKITENVFRGFEYKKRELTVELHICAKGGHGFGMRKDGLPINDWPRRCAEWMKSLSYLNEK